MLDKLENGVYYLNDYSKDTLMNISALRDNKQKAIDYYMDLLHIRLDDYKLDEFDIVTCIPNQDGGNTNDGIIRILNLFSDTNKDLEFMPCLCRSGNVIDVCDDRVKNKNILLFDYLTDDCTSFKACKDALKDAEANLVVCISLEKNIR